MSAPARGEVWWAGAEDKRRPVLVVTRSEAAQVLPRSPSTPRPAGVARRCPGDQNRTGDPTEVALGPEEGLPESCATVDNLQPIRPSFLTQRVGRLDDARRAELCRALSALADC